MKILGIESASLVASAAIVADETLVAEYTVNFKKTHSQTLLPMIDEIVKMVDLDLQEIDGIAISGGPGSFTGLRIGGATAKGLGLALKKPLLHIPTLEALAFNLWGSDALICPMMDARRNQVYTGLYHMKRDPEIVMDQDACDIHDLIAKINAQGERVVFLGDGVPVYQKVLEAELTVPYAFAPAHMNAHRAASVAVLGKYYLQQGKEMPAAEFEPDYLRKSQAEREREARTGEETV